MHMDVPPSLLSFGTQNVFIDASYHLMSMSLFNFSFIYLQITFIYSA